MKAFVRMAAVVVLVAMAAGAVGLWWISTHRFSAKAMPGRLETIAARQLRRLAIGRSARELSNPVPRTPEALHEGMEHYADHCAVCHANDGSGDTEMGRGLYPKVPDMRLPATQSLTDGELFFIIENGVRFTGMPAWSTGTPAGEQDSWRLVHFVRHLPELTAAEVTHMETLTPKSPAEIREQAEEEKFLEGEAPSKH
jgi:mono/diheme cytochrome c family protein